MRRIAFIACVTVALVGCGDGNGSTGDPPAIEPVFPADYASTYTEVRNCRQSGDHDLNIIRVLADPTALGPYQNHDKPIPEGAVLLKEEYEFSDVTCSGPILKWTVMVRLANGASPDTLDWHWQDVDSMRRVTSDNLPRCHQCHAACTNDMGGYDYTCTLP